ncbi:MAG: TolC family protein [Candidatus Brocadiae bacterium]|nr:TolC family protein [Candidatus Brocadiia bacterium]
MRPSTRTILLLLATAHSLCAQEAPNPPGGTPPGDPPPTVEPVAEPVDTRPRLRLTLERCLELALDQNLDLQHARLEPGLYEGDLLSQRGEYDPVAYATGTRRSVHSQSSSSLAGAAILNDDVWAATVGVKGTWLLGTTWDFNFESNRDENNNSFSTLNPRWNSSFGFSVRQPLLRNAWMDYNLITAHITKLNQRSAVSRVGQTSAETLYAVELAYWTLVNAYRQKEVKDRALELARRLYEVNRNKVKAGALAPIEELRAESEVASQMEGIILAGNDIEDAMDELRRLIMPWQRRDSWDVVIEPADDPAFEARAVDVEAAVQDGLAHRPELEQHRLTIETSKLNEKRYRREQWPTLDLTGSLRYAGLGVNFGDSLEAINTSNYDTWEIGLIFEYPIGARAAKGGILRSENERRRAELSLRSQEQVVVLEVRDAAREMNSAAQRIEATRTAARLAQRASEAERARFERGLTTSHSLLQYLRDQTDAESNAAKAVVDWLIAQLKLRKATGRLLTERAERR